jgi:hypothetical protein
MFTGAAGRSRVRARLGCARVLLRVGVSAGARYPNVIATLTPVVFSCPRTDSSHAGKKIDSITALDFMVGLGYRM